ncbi:MAG: hypothetical protein A7316_10495 [Candidatus Altiarchaeales archaeon WOR_SM1_86-2]|nr:MAG: hypothetical protein A7316_10495 [Candidatus Altiarchaeales archaeon WOR_SM1_86-2]
MSKIKEKEIEKIRRRVEEEFPSDSCLQQVHIARKILAREAELEGLSFLEYIKLLGKQVKSVQV